VIETIVSYLFQRLANTTDDLYTMIEFACAPVVRVFDIKEMRKPKDGAGFRV